MGINDLLSRLGMKIPDVPPVPGVPASDSKAFEWNGAESADVPPVPLSFSDTDPGTSGTSEITAPVPVRDLQHKACTAGTGGTSQRTKVLHDAVFCPDSAVDRNSLKRCPDCQHLARPGKSDGYCGGRNDLPLAYGINHPLRKLPADHGVACDQWQATQ